VKQPIIRNSELEEPILNESERRVLSRKEYEKEKRRAMYQNAKEKRATDPRYIKMKEVAKEKRRAAYQKVKDRRKAVVAEEKEKRKAAVTKKRVEHRIESNRELMKLVDFLSSTRSAQND
jgi:hypothetical protein